MHRLIKVLFALSDTAAWFMLTISVLLAITCPFVLSVSAKMEHQQLTAVAVIVPCVGLLLVAVGAYAITRRKAIGLVLVMLPAVPFLASGLFMVGLSLIALLAVVFASPFVLVFVQARSASTSGPAA